VSPTFKREGKHLEDTVKWRLSVQIPLQGNDILSLLEHQNSEYYCQYYQGTVWCGGPQTKVRDVNGYDLVITHSSFMLNRDITGKEIQILDANSIEA